MKTMLSRFILLMLLIPFDAYAGKYKKEILKQLNFTEGQYEVVVPKTKATDFCEDEILKIEVIEDKDDVTLLIGSKLAFPDINKATVNFESNPNCITTQSTQLESKKLTLWRSEKCADDKKKIIPREFQINFKNDVVDLVIRDGDNASSCQYKKINNNQKGK